MVISECFSPLDKNSIALSGTDVKRFLQKILKKFFPNVCSSQTPRGTTGAARPNANKKPFAGKGGKTAKGRGKSDLKIKGSAKSR